MQLELLLQSSQQDDCPSQRFPTRLWLFYIREVRVRRVLEHRRPPAALAAQGRGMHPGTRPMISRWAALRPAAAAGVDAAEGEAALSRKIPTSLSTV